jgi:hypothetical protein
MTDRYDTTGNPEDEYYPGTSGLINRMCCSKCFLSYNSTFSSSIAYRESYS